MQNHIQAWLTLVCNEPQGVNGALAVQIRESGLERVAQWLPHSTESFLQILAAQSATDTMVHGLIGLLAPGITSPFTQPNRFVAANA